MCSEGPDTKEAGEEERRDLIPDLHRSAYFFPSFAIFDRQYFIGFLNLVLRILKAEGPAHSAKPCDYTKSQIAYSIYHGRRHNANKPGDVRRPSAGLTISPGFSRFSGSYQEQKTSS